VLIVKAIPDVGELMLASFPSDPQFTLATQPNAWYSPKKYIIKYSKKIKSTNKL
jgi:hypothetical protein